MSQDVQSALVTYYKLVLNFAVDVHGEFAGGRLSMLDVNYVQYRLTFSETTLNAVHRTLKSKLADLQTDIHHAIDDVDKGATIDCLDNIRAGVSDLQANLANVLGTPPTAASACIVIANILSQNPNSNVKFRCPAIHSWNELRSSFCKRHFHWPKTVSK